MHLGQDIHPSAKSGQASIRWLTGCVNLTSTSWETCTSRYTLRQRDRGGNSVKVIVDGFNHKPRDELHAFGTPSLSMVLPKTGNHCQQLIDQITPDRRPSGTGIGQRWAMEAFHLQGRRGDPPLSKTLQHLDANYVSRAERDVVRQLSRAGVRLAFIPHRPRPH